MTLKISRNPDQNIFIIDYHSLLTARIGMDGFMGQAGVYLDVPHSWLVMREEIAQFMVNRCLSCDGRGRQDNVCCRHCRGTGYVCDGKLLDRYIKQHGLAERITQDPRERG